MEIAKLSYQETNCFPQIEQFGLVQQIRRASVSVPSNISEGYSRKSRKEFKQFCFIALGSLGELETQLLLSKELGFLNEKTVLLELIRQERAMILKLCHKQEPGIRRQEPE